MARATDFLNAPCTTCGLPVATLAMIAIVGGACANTEPFQRAASDVEISEGDVLAQKLARAIGKEAFDTQVQSIRFTWTIESLGLSVARESAWDKRRGLYRLTDGDEVIWLDLWNKTGAATDAGKFVTDSDALADLLRKAEQAFINDTYWFLAPFKVFDPGAHRANIDGKLRISFDDGVGMTSGDVYLFTLGATGLPERWTFRLESGISADFTFEQPKEQLGATFFLKRSGLVDVRFDDVEITAGPQDAWFAPLLQARGEAAPAAG